MCLTSHCLKNPYNADASASLTPEDTPLQKKLCYLEWEGQQGAEAGLDKGAAVVELPEALT